jgi:pyridoxamine 5'-phosphate oxidase family protein
MSVSSDAGRTYLAKGKLGRLATIDGTGMPHVVPLGWRYNPELDTIDIGGRDFAAPGNSTTRSTIPNIALVVDDVLPPWRPRCVLIRGRAEALADAPGPDGEPTGPIIRRHHAEVISWGMGRRPAVTRPRNLHPQRQVSKYDRSLSRLYRCSSIQRS